MSNPTPNEVPSRTLPALLAAGADEWNRLLPGGAIEICDGHFDRSYRRLGKGFLNTLLRRREAVPHELGGAILTGARLIGCSFRGANLRKAELGEADLERSTFYDADLQDVDLSTCKHLTAAQLGGANLAGATVSESLGKWEGLAQVAETSKNAATLFLTLLAVCAFAALTINSATDAALLTGGSTSQVPLLGMTLNGLLLQSRADPSAPPLPLLPPLPAQALAGDGGAPGGLSGRP